MKKGISGYAFQEDLVYCFYIDDTFVLQEN